MARWSIVLFAAMALAVFAALAAPARAQESPPPPAYVGSGVCADCHAAQARAWTGSDHDLAWTLPEDGAVLGDFDDASFVSKGVLTRFTRSGADYFVETEGPGGERRRYRVDGVAGIRPLQQYLLQTEPGRLQALDIAWDAENGRWYDLYPDQALPPSDGLHWTGPYKTWNARCADCHATGYRKNYDAERRRYASAQAEIGVGCEACHGPGAEHVKWARAPSGAYVPRPGLSEAGLTIAFSADAPATEIEQCAGCHSRREAFLDGSPLPGTPYHDAWRLSPLRPGLYHPDGAILDEVYVYGSFLQSKMNARGVRCSDCHDPHAGKVRLEGAALCAQCHSPAGNPRFPSLRKALYDDPSHYFHEPGSAGAQCVACHMIERVYMGVDGRRDHSFRVPRPDLTVSIGVPNACSDCHADRDAGWAAAEIAARFPDPARRGPSFAETFFSARIGAAGMAPQLLGIATHGGLPGIVRATALEMLAQARDPGAAARVAALLRDPDPLVRAAAVAVQRGAPPQESIPRIAPLLSDPTRAVRIAAARGFLGAPIARLPRRTEAALKAAQEEWLSSLRVKRDFPEVNLVLGGRALVMRDAAAAEAAFREAARLDPQRVEAWRMVVRIRAALGDGPGARAALAAALAANPANAMLRAMVADLPPAK